MNKVYNDFVVQIIYGLYRMKNFTTTDGYKIIKKATQTLCKDLDKESLDYIDAEVLRLSDEIESEKSDEQNESD